MPHTVEDNRLRNKNHEKINKIVNKNFLDNKI